MHQVEHLHVSLKLELENTFFEFSGLQERNNKYVLKMCCRAFGVFRL